LTTRTMRRHESRIMALSALFCWEVGKASPEDSFAFVARDFFDAAGVADKIRQYNYAAKLYLAAVTNVTEIDSAISRASQGWQISRMPKVDLSILRLALAEANYLKEAPLEVVIDEALELSKEFSTHASPRFVNGVLMGIFRELGHVPKSTK
jgi:N utilization substance protein B